MSFPTTGTPPGAAGYGNYVMVAAVSHDTRIFYNWWKLGEGGHEWREVEAPYGLPYTVLAPAVSFIPNVDIATSLNTFLAIQDLDGNISYNTNGGFGSAFHGWAPFVGGPPIKVSPAATVSTNTVFGKYDPVILATAPDGHILYNMGRRNMGLDGNGWDATGWMGLGGDVLTDAAPAAALVGDPGAYYLFVAIKGLDNQLYLNQGGLSGPFVGWRPMNFPYHTNVAPGATSAENTSVVVATDTDGRIFYTWWKLGEAGHKWLELEGDGRTDAAPAAALVGENSDYLFVVVKGPGLDAPLLINQGQLGRPFVGWQPL